MRVQKCVLFQVENISIFDYLWLCKNNVECTKHHVGNNSKIFSKSSNILSAALQTLFLLFKSEFFDILHLCDFENQLKELRKLTMTKAMFLST